MSYTLAIIKPFKLPYDRLQLHSIRLSYTSEILTYFATYIYNDKSVFYNKIRYNYYNSNIQTGT